MSWNSPNSWRRAAGYMRMQTIDWSDKCYLVVVETPAELVSAELRLGRNYCRVSTPKRWDAEHRSELDQGRN